jgi:choline dehydrogenase-like flavoprotein
LISDAPPTASSNDPTTLPSHPNNKEAATRQLLIPTKREVAPGNLNEADLERFIRNGLVTFWHQCGTAKMGRDSVSVADGRLKVYGIGNFRIADGSIMPRVTTGNTMAPCVVIGELAGDAED